MGSGWTGVLGCMADLLGIQCGQKHERHPALESFSPNMELDYFYA